MNNRSAKREKERKKLEEFIGRNKSSTYVSRGGFIYRVFLVGFAQFHFVILIQKNIGRGKVVCTSVDSFYIRLLYI